MKQMIMLAVILGHSCSMKPPSDEVSKLTKMWTTELKQSDVIETYGPDYKEVEGGITYQRSKSSWPRFAFFFDKEKNVRNQFALLDRDELDRMKNKLDCFGSETQNKIVTPHATQAIPIGECKKYSIRYEYKKDWGLYEVKWKK